MNAMQGNMSAVGNAGSDNQYVVSRCRQKTVSVSVSFFVKISDNQNNVEK